MDRWHAAREEQMRVNEPLSLLAERRKVRVASSWAGLTFRVKKRANQQGAIAEGEMLILAKKNKAVATEKKADAASVATKRYAGGAAGEAAAEGEAEGEGWPEIPEHQLTAMEQKLESALAATHDMQVPAFYDITIIDACMRLYTCFAAGVLIHASIIVIS